MKVISHEFPNLTRTDEITIIPLGDIHIGHKACNEARLKETIDRISNDPNCYFIGMGDYCDFINVQDKRFDPDSLASWLELSHLSDIAKAQRDKFLTYIKPIAHKCLGLIQGNHEEFIKSRYERDVYLEIVSGIKELSKTDKNLALFYNGWLLLEFKTKHEKVYTVKFSLHHGFVGGKLAGAKALNMQRWLWTHECDVAIFGHSHNTGVQIESIQRPLPRTNTIETVNRYGCYSGTFLENYNQDGPAMYSERKGYFPLGMGGVEIILKPFAKRREDRIRIVTKIG